MGRYLHLFETEGEYGAARESDYNEPWVSLTVKGTGDVKSFIGEYGNGSATIERQFNYFGSYGDDYVNTDIIESDITAIDGENQTVTVDGYAFNFENSQDDKYFYSYQGETQTTGTVERTWIEELQIGGQTQQISACTVNGATFVMIQSGGGQYYWIEIDFAAMSIGSKSFIADHEIQVNESVTITEQVELNGYTSVEPAVGALFKYINHTNSTMEFISDNGRRVQVGDVYDGIVVKSIVESGEGETINRVNYNRTEYEKQLKTPLTFEIQSDGNIVIGSQDYILEYKKNDGEWVEVTSSTGGTVVSVVSGDTVQFRGNNGNGIGGSIFNGTTSQFIIKGNIMSLVNKELFNKLTNVSSLNSLFNNCTGLTDASKLLLPATTLGYGCYTGMFYGCTSLTQAPELPATTLGQVCYRDMFYGCTSLTTAPSILPATTLKYECYNRMFYGCTSLTTAPELPATTIIDGNCYCDMFYGCTSLTTAPELPATTLSNDCYRGMFQNCTSLTTAPELPATTLETGCYSNMFNGCTSLTTAPELPATTLTGSCYQSMFDACSSLNYIKCLATDISEYHCTYDWVSGVASTGTFVKAASMTGWTEGDNGVPTGWTVQDA